MSQRIIKQIFQIDSKVISDEFQNLLTKEYLNRNYMNDENIEGEVTKMTKTLYDPEVEKRGELKKLK